MKKKTGRMIGMALGILLLTGCGGRQVEETAGYVTADGSTSMEKVIGVLGESFEELHPEIRFTYNPTGSGSGITAVAEGRCDIGLSSRSLSEEERNKGLRETVLAYDGIAVIVHPDNPLSDMTIEQLAAVFTGEIQNWSEIGGADGEIVLIGREAGSGTRDGFENITKTAGSAKNRVPVPSGADFHRRCDYDGGSKSACDRICFSGLTEGTGEGRMYQWYSTECTESEGRELCRAAALCSGDPGKSRNLTRCSGLL